MLLYLILTCVFITEANAAFNCDAEKEFSKKFLVSNDPTQFLKGSFVNYWVFPAKKETPTCSYTEYTKNKDGIKAATTLTDTKHKKLHSVDDFLKKASPELPGFLEITSTTHDKSGKKVDIKGHSAIFYADQFVIVYQYCVSSKEWKSHDLILSVKKGNKHELFAHKDDTTAPNKVQESLAVAKKKFTEILVTLPLDSESKETAPLERKVEDLPSDCPWN